MRPVRRRFSSMLRLPLFVPNTEAAGLFETFLVSAVATVLAIRVYLRVADYPQLGSGGLHIAHMLWGGLLMLAAMVVLLGFLTKASREVASFLGGVGFGAFIDEVGKFVTSDNDYFFQPAVALIYACFVLLFLAIESLKRVRVLSAPSAVVNALELAKEAVLHDLDADERRAAFALLARAGPTTPLSQALERLFTEAIEAPHSANPLTRLRGQLERFYDRLTALRWFNGALVFVLVARTLVSASAVIVVVDWTVFGITTVTAAAALAVLARYGRNHRLTVWPVALAAVTVALAVSVSWAVLLGPTAPDLSVVDWGTLAFPAVSSVLVGAGVLRIRTDRLAAFLMFQRAVLVDILLTQVFIFARDQFAALGGLGLSVLILLSLRLLVHEEKAKLAG